MVPEKDAITSPQNQYIQLVRRLISQSKFRKKHNAFVAEGVRLVEEGARSSLPLQFMLFNDQLSERGSVLLNELPPSIPAYLVDNRIFQEISDTETTQGILAVFALESLPLPEKPDFLLIVDNLRDPGNLGTILRTAEAAGVEGVLLAPGTTDPFAPKVVRAGMGAHFRLPIHTLSWQQIAELTHGLNLYRTEMDAEQNLWQTDLTQPCAIIVGSEAEGTSAEGKALTKLAMRIPMRGESESLNAAVAAGILLFEVRRQRSQRK